MNIPSTSNPFCLTCAFLTAAAILPLGQSAHAATTTWNNDGTDFNTTSPEWSNGNPAGNIAAFSTTAVTQPNVSANISITGLQFGAGGYDLTATSGAVVTFSAAGTSNINLIGAGVTNTIDAPLVLGTTGNFNFTGTASGSLGNASNILNLRGVISGSGSVQYGGAATYNVSGTNTYSAGTNDNSTALVNISNAAAFGTGNLIFRSATIDNTSSGTLTLPNALTNASGTTGTSITYAGTGGQSIIFGAMANTVNNSSFAVNAQTVTITGSIGTATTGTLTNTLTKTGTGTLLLNGADSNTGAVAVNAGTFGGAGSVAGMLTIASGSTLSPGSTNASGNIGTFGAGAGLALNGTYLVDLGANANSTDLTTVTGALTLTTTTSTLSVRSLTASVATGTVYEILTDTSGTVTNTFKGLADGTIYTDASGDTFTVHYNDLTNGTITGDVSLTLDSVATVPEPSTFASGLLITGVGLYQLLRRRLQA